MRFPIAILVMLSLSACGGEQKPKSTPLSKTPVSVRGWIADIEAGESGTLKTVETEMARRVEQFQQTNVWVENAAYVSGGIAETGSFILLDVPPGNVTITFTAPVIGDSKLVLENVPGNADVLIPGLVLKRGAIAIADPSKIRVRVASRDPKPSPLKARIAGHTVAVTEVPPNELTDRRDYPAAPGMQAPVATVR